MTRQLPMSTRSAVFVAALALVLSVAPACKPRKAGTSKPAAPESRSSAKTAPSGGSSGAVELPPFVHLAKELNPAVVNISTTRKIEGLKFHSSPHPSPGEPDGGEGGKDPLDDFFNRFFGNLPHALRKQASLGSGFVIAESGLVVTNYHVIEKADDIKVTTSDGKVYAAKVRGVDPKTDVALIEIKPDGGLPTVQMGDSDKLEIGEWVMAIGNPFGLTHTVTAGIVSAKGRVINSGPYDDFIQTDASINPGNSGGPLFNMRGEVVGINTAIVAQGQGIGFAVPINQARAVLTQLEKTGKVIRGWLGVSIQKLEPPLAESFGLKDANGALVADVMKGSPAAEAGIQRGDVIIEFNGQTVDDFHDLPGIVAQVPPGKRVPIKVFRQGKPLDLSVQVAELKEEKEAEPKAPHKADVMGLNVEEVSPELAQRFGIEKGTGVVVTEIDPDGSAEEAGIEAGDIILEIDRKPIHGKRDYEAALQAVKGKDSALMLIRRGQNSLYVPLRLK